jgi:ribosomal protein S7
MVESSERLSLPEVIRTSGKGLRPKIRTVTEAIHLIDEELPIELRSLKRWTFARELLVHAERSRKKRDLTSAMRQLRQALSQEGWLAPEQMEQQGTVRS